MTAQAGCGATAPSNANARASTLADTRRRRFAVIPQDGTQRGNSAAEPDVQTWFAIMAIAPLQLTNRRRDPKARGSVLALSESPTVKMKIAY
jgi:hypothetical protein